MAKSVDLAGLSPLAKGGMALLVIGLIVSLSGFLNNVGLEFKGFQLMDAVFGPNHMSKLVFGIPIVVLGGILFRMGGGKEHLQRQKSQDASQKPRS